MKEKVVKFILNNRIKIYMQICVEIVTKINNKTKSIQLKIKHSKIKNMQLC